MISINKLIEEEVSANSNGWEIPRKGWRYRKNWLTVHDIPGFVNEGIPKTYLEADITEEIEKLVKEATDKNKGLYLHGPAGTGKTYFLYGLMRRKRLEKQECIFINATAWLAELRQRMDGGTQNHGLGLEYWINRDVRSDKIMFIDDMAVEKPTEWNDEIIYRLINYRSENMLETHFASNLTLQELSEKKGDRIASRIAGMCVPKEIGGKDRRLG